MSELWIVISILFIAFTAYLLVKKFNSQTVLNSQVSRFIVYACSTLFYLNGKQNV